MKFLLLIAALMLSTNTLSSVTWSWTHDGKYTDGTDALGVFFNLTCNGNLKPIINFPETSYTGNPSVGEVITCSVTANDAVGNESGPLVFETWTVGGEDTTLTLKPATDGEVSEN